MNIKDNYLPKELFADLQKYVNENDFQIVEAGDKSFSVLPVPDWLLPHLEIEGHSIILTFIRRAWKDFDDTLRAHCDGLINGKQTALASVLYLNNKHELEPTGTAFYEHHIHGKEFKGDEAEFNRLITEDADDYDKWKLVDSVFSEPNRMLIYKASRFHGKFPNRIIRGERKVLVTFYEKN